MKHLNLHSIFMNAILNYNGERVQLNKSSYFVNSRGQIVLTTVGEEKKTFFITVDKGIITVDFDSYRQGKSLLTTLNHNEEITEVKLGDEIISDNKGVSIARGYVAAVAVELLAA